MELNTLGVTPTDACATFQAILRELARWQRKQANVGEESLTDWLLFQLAERHSWIRYRKFNRREEARETGADWEWWFVWARGSVGLRVQAKKLMTTDNYTSIAYTNRYGLQIERLREAAMDENLLPFYAFYSDGSTAFTPRCGLVPCFGKDEGAFLVDANQLYITHISKSGRRPVPAADILQYSNPLGCLACCRLANSHHASGVEKFYEYLKRYHSATLREVDEATGQGATARRGFHTHLPAHVSSLLDLGSDAPVPDWWEGEFRQSVQEARALLIFDLRRDDVA